VAAVEWRLDVETRRDAARKPGGDLLPPGQRLVALDQPAIAISPDGKNLVYVAIDGSSSQQLYLRPLDRLESKPIAGTEGVSPFFSPDGQWIGFSPAKADEGRGRRSVATLAASGGASWSSQGILAFQSQALQQVSQEGGPQQPLTKAGRTDAFHRWPEFLPGGTAVLFAGSPTNAAWNNSEIGVQLVEVRERTSLVQRRTQPNGAWVICSTRRADADGRAFRCATPRRDGRCPRAQA
jgi:Tol biopolymer transport system component